MRTRIRRSATAIVILLVVVFSGASYEAEERPTVMGRNAGVSAGHPLTTAAAIETLQKGGNAFDAGVAALLVGGVVEQDL
jgi:gamma-glutamyltranspeptidase/glutathione hydrolase